MNLNFKKLVAMVIITSVLVGVVIGAVFMGIF